MIWSIDLAVLALIVVCAVAAISVKGLMSAVIIFGAYSFFMCLLWTEMGAVDVAFTEAAVGAGAGTVFMVAALFRSTRRLARRSRGRWFMKSIGALAAGAMGMLLASGVSSFPDWADSGSPASTHVSPYYILHALEDTSVPNLVTAVLADYRGFDTMFETVVVFVAGLAVMVILRRRPEDPEPFPERSPVPGPPHQSMIIMWVVRQMIPFIQIFALYVVAHGHDSPGGGFQGGVIMGASFILIGISYDLETLLLRMGERANSFLGSLGVSIYAGIGAICLLMGANFLDYGVLERVLPFTDEITARSHAMLGIELGVALTVMAVMVAIYVNLSSNGRHRRGL